MTAHTITFDPVREASVRAASTGLPVHLPAAAPEIGADVAARGMARLDAFLLEEGPGLARLLSRLDLSGGQADLRALGALMREPMNPEAALATAAGCLDRLVEDLAEVSLHAEGRGLVRAGEVASLPELDEMVRWLGARTQEMRDLARHVIG